MITPTDCDIYACQLKGYEFLNEKGKPMVLKLSKSLYGLKQIERNWSNWMELISMDQYYSLENVLKCFN